MDDTDTTGNEDLLDEGDNLAGDNLDGSDAGESAWSGLSSETASGLLPSTLALGRSLNMFLRS